MIAALSIIGYLVLGLIAAWLFGSTARFGRGEE
jgi:ABC-type Fe3+ transport system permease subunit